MTPEEIRKIEEEYEESRWKKARKRLLGEFEKACSSLGGKLEEGFPKGSLACKIGGVKVSLWLDDTSPIGAFTVDFGEELEGKRLGVTISNYPLISIIKKSE